MRTLKNTVAFTALFIAVFLLRADAQTPAKPVNTGKVFASVEQMPAFPGGNTAMHQYVEKNLKYPDADKDKNISGKVVVQFTVEPDGTLTDVKAVRGPSESMKKEAVRVVKSSPKWTPGIQNGKPVRTSFVLPVDFSLGG